MSDIFSGGTFFVGYRVCACAFTARIEEIYSGHSLQRITGVLARRMLCLLLFVDLAKVSTFTDGFVLEGGITNCRVNQ